MRGGDDMTSKQILEELEGCEVISREFEGSVLIENGELIQGGKAFKATTKQVKSLWDDYLEQKGINTEARELNKAFAKARGLQSRIG